eukprot:3524746-Amphidinium_carterae.1
MSLKILGNVAILLGRMAVHYNEELKERAVVPRGNAAEVNLVLWHGMGSNVPGLTFSWTLQFASTAVTVAGSHSPWVSLQYSTKSFGAYMPPIHMTSDQDQILLATRG